MLDGGGREDLELSGAQPYLVTGASGHVGANLMRRLLADRAQVRAVVRHGSDNRGVDGLPVERVYCDVRDAGALEAAARGCRGVFHCALPCPGAGRGAEERRLTFETHVLGTRNVVHAALRAGVPRVVVVGSLLAGGRERSEASLPTHEEVPFDPFERRTAAAITLAQAEAECWRAAAQGLQVIVAACGVAVGPHDYKPSLIGRLLIAHARGRLRVFVPGGFEFIGVDDLTAGLCLAMARGRPGAKYLLSSEYLTIEGLLERFEAATVVPRARVRLPSRLGEGLALARGLLGGERLSPWVIRTLRMRLRADTGRARGELGFRPAPVQESIRRAYEHFLERGVLAPPRARAAARPAG
ncbi:MAG: NAD-dependent epimerase/dehydratase family protein [Nannocystaceae bacterium]|nr:NAD-dependent epimerase/dehydratase family protein [Myxococcales bacterium]